MFESQPERVLCRDYSFDRHCHGQSKSLLLTIIDVASGRGVGMRVAKALFEHLKGMGLNVLPKLWNVVIDNASNAIAAVKHMFQLINATVGYEQMCPCNHVHCADHSV